MSQESITRFYAQLAGSSSLQTEWVSAIQRGHDAVLALGRSNGCEFSDREIEAMAASRDLTDLELETATGGRGAPPEPRDKLAELMTRLGYR